MFDDWDWPKTVTAMFLCFLFATCVAFGIHEDNETLRARHGAPCK